MVISSFMSKRASLATTPVISLVSEAMGSTAESFLLNSTSRVSWSITKATLDFKSSSSCMPCRPAIWPKDSLGGAGGT